MRIDRIYRHPVKSVGAERLDAVALEAGKPMPGDRAFAVAHAGGEWDPGAPEWMRCRNFARVAYTPALSAVDVSYDAPARRIDCQLHGQPDIRADLNDAEGRQAFADWVGGIVGDTQQGPFRLAEVPGASLTDSPQQTPSLMSLRSLEALGETLGADLDPRRFRGNIWVDDLEPWAEFDMAGRVLAVGDVRLRVTEPIERCVATAANPETGLRDSNPLPTLKRMHGQPLFGMLVEILAGGQLEAGMTAALSDN